MTETININKNWINLFNILKKKKIILPTLIQSIDKNVYKKISTKNKKLLNYLDNYNFWFVEEKLLENKKFKTQNKLKESVLEFKKFFGLIIIYDIGLPMRSPQVDEVWHQLILFTKEYTLMCNELFETYLHHVPTIKNNKKAEIQTKKKHKNTNIKEKEEPDFYDLYKKTYGNISKTWL